MRRLIAAALLWASPACAQEAEPPAEKPPLTAEEKAEIARLLDDEEKRAGRGASNWDSNIWGSMVAARNMATEPPPPPLQDHPCDAFAENELVEVKVANDVNPQPVGLLIPASYLPIHRVQSYRITDIEAVFLMNAWHHDFAPYDLRRQFFSLGKKPNDELSFLVRGGEGGSRNELDVIARRFAAADTYEADAGYDLEQAAERAGFDQRLGLWRIELQNTLSDGGAWIRFDNDGSATDLIKCIIGPNNQRCSHEMSFGPFRPRVTYDDALIDHWASIRAMTETFFGCARAAFLTERGKS